MSSSTFNGGPGQKVPAWKRLGLKLKPAAPTEPGAAPAAGSQPNGARNQDLGVNASSAAKRKRPDVSAPAASSSPLKKVRLDDKHAVAHTPILRKQKSVTFTDDTKNPADAKTANGVKTPAKKAKPTATKPKQSKQQPTADPKPALDYLRAWKHSRETWKFNKNYQTLLIKRAFDPHALPTENIEIFYEYIRDLKGGLRLRLRDTARDIRKQDAAEGKGGFPAGTMDVQAKQAEYDAIIAGILQLGLGAGNKRKRFDEVTFMQAPPEPVLAHRVIKRMRAELIDEELTDSDDEKSEEESDSEALTTTTEATTVAAAEDTADEATPKHVEVRLDDKARATPVADADAKRVRRRKLRVAAEDTSSDESSSSSDSDSDSASSDSDSSDSDDSDSDEDERGAEEGENDDDDDSTDSSDSGSSESDDESDDEAEDSDSDKSDSESDSDSEDEQPAKAPMATQPKKTVVRARA